jgi:glycosyltransferase involved in cell wall biosynthesis
MSDSFSSPPIIRPVPGDMARPVWSVMIPAYNCAQYLPQTLESVLSQGIPEEQMQIEVVDDASTDADIRALVERLGQGRIGYFRQLENVGSLRNFETCINRSRGRLVHILHGDDVVKKGYYGAMEGLFRQYPEAGAAFCRFSYMDENGTEKHIQTCEQKQDGILENWVSRIAEHQRIQYAAITVRREVYEKVGGFYAITYGEDWEMWVRIARYFPVAYTPKVLAAYRKHRTSISGDKLVNGQNVRDLVQAMKIIQTHLPVSQRQNVLKRSKRYYAHHSLKIANQIWQKFGNKKMVITQLREALLLSSSPALWWKAGKLYFKMKINKA